MYTYEKIPEDLRARPHWVLWRKVWRDEKQKFDKIPTQVNGYPASITNPQHFSSFEAALFAYQLGVADGIGYCFTESDDLVFVDIDGAVNCVGWTEEHLPILQSFSTWGELSQSGKGVHFIAKGHLDKSRAYHPAGLELYGSGRFVAMTGWQLDSWPAQITEQQDAIDSLAAHIDRLRGTAGQQMTGDVGPRPELSAEVPELDALPVSRDVYRFLTEGDAGKWDQDRSRAIFASALSLFRAGLSDSEALTVLWQQCGHIAAEHRSAGNPLDWLWKYSVGPARQALPPDIDPKFEPVTEAVVPDLLARLLTRGRQLAGTVEDIAAAREILQLAVKLDQGSKIAIHAAVRERMGWTKADLAGVLKELSREQRTSLDGGSNSAAEVLAQYVYLAGSHGFLHAESGNLLRPEAFLALHGHVDPDLRDTSLASGGVSKVHGMDFAPGEPTYFRRFGALYFNAWTGLSDAGLVGDITPWWRHLCLLVPDAEPREHLLDWLAHTLQRPDRKINHCVVLCGSQGQGKDTLFWPVTQALGRHCRQIGAEALGEDFNDYVLGTKLLIVQESDVGNWSDSKRIANKIKPFIASPPDTLSINSKGIKRFEVQNIVHTIMYSNDVTHPIHISPDDRRYFVLQAPVSVTDEAGRQTPEWAEYFRGLWAWLDAAGGWRAVVGYLMQRDLSRFDPKAAPPMTAAKETVIDQGRSALEQLLRAMAAQGFINSGMSATTIQTVILTTGNGFMTQYGVDLKQISVSKIGRILSGMGAIAQEHRASTGHQRSWHLEPITTPGAPEGWLD